MTGVAAMTEISVVIPSFRRPVGLQRTIAAVLAQQHVDAPVEIVVVDNDPERSAEPVIAALAPASALPIRYVPEPRRGISHARNAGVAAAAGRYLAFLDDDEEVGPDWLAAFLACLDRYAADAAVGPVFPRFPGAEPVADHCYRAFVCDAQAPSGTVLLRWNIGNSIFVKERCFTGAEPFDPRLGLTGGEDTMFMRQLTRNGARLVWCAEAVASETVPAERLDPHYLVRRVFRGAQTTTYVSATVRPPELGRAARLMAIGCVQSALWGPPALMLRLFGRESWLPVALKAVAGLGKVFWHPRLHLRLYR